MTTATKDDLKRVEEKIDNKIQTESRNRHDADNMLTKQYFTLLEKVDDQLPHIFDKLNDIALKLNTNDEKTKSLKEKVDNHISSSDSGVSWKVFVWSIGLLTATFAFTVVIFINFMSYSFNSTNDIKSDIQTIKTVLSISNIE